MTLVEVENFRKQIEGTDRFTFDGYSFHVTKKEILGRIFDLSEYISQKILGFEQDFKMLKNLALSLYERSTNPKPDTGTSESVGYECWFDPNGLTNRYLRVNTPNQPSGIILQKILVGAFEAQTIMEEVNNLGLIPNSEYAWGLLEQLTVWRDFTDPLKSPKRQKV